MLGCFVCARTKRWRSRGLKLTRAPSPPTLCMRAARLAKQKKEFMWLDVLIRCVHGNKSFSIRPEFDLFKSLHMLWVVISQGTHVWPQFSQGNVVAKALFPPHLSVPVSTPGAVLGMQQRAVERRCLITKRVLCCHIFWLRRKKATLQDLCRLYQASAQLPHIVDALAQHEGQHAPLLKELYGTVIVLKLGQLR